MGKRRALGCFLCCNNDGVSKSMNLLSFSNMGANLGSLLLILVASIEYHMNVVVSTGSAIYTQRTKVVVSKYHQIVNLDVSLSYVT